MVNIEKEWGVVKGLPRFLIKISFIHLYPQEFAVNIPTAYSGYAIISTQN
jgi:hypothetical protein